MEFLEQIGKGLVLADGAMGTELMEGGVGLDRCLEELSVSEPERVRAVHRAYVEAGVELIGTNTFGANGVRLGRHGLGGRVGEINRAAVALAREEAAGRGVWVAGSVGPLGLTAERVHEMGLDRGAMFREQVEALAGAGVDLLILETFGDLAELLEALAVAKEAGAGLPLVASLVCGPEGRLASGVALGDAFARLRAGGADVVGVNCLNGPSSMERLLARTPIEGAVSAMPNAGHPHYHEGRYLYFTTPAYFAESARRMVDMGVRMVGGCCGIGPRHIAEMVRALRGVKPGVPRRVSEVRERFEVEAGEGGAAEAEEESLVERMAAGRTVIVTELDPPKTLEMGKFLAGARELTRAGSDAITLADNSLAILRVSNLAAGVLLKQRYGIVPLLHVSCRDRNLLGLQSELMGMAALGMRHVLALTGDPAKVGDHPGAASVYDINSVELIRVIARLNEGYNHAGKAIRVPGRFVVGCTFNPNARNLDAQVSRLERKVAAGAAYVMTQPVFDVRLVEATAERTAHLGVPVFVGVWPLLNGRQAEFLHNEVPGIVVPEEVRAAMAGLEGAAGRRRGLEIAREVCRAVVDRFRGVYLITPFLNYELTAELAAFVRGRSGE